MTRSLEEIIGIVAEALNVLQQIGQSRPDYTVEPINAAILALAEHATAVQAERDELLEALTEATNQRRPTTPADRVFSIYLRERGKYRDAGDLECQLDEAMAANAAGPPK